MVHGCMVYTERFERFHSFTWHQPCNNQTSNLVDVKKRAADFSRLHMNGANFSNGRPETNVLISRLKKEANGVCTTDVCVTGSGANPAVCHCSEDHSKLNNSLPTKRFDHQRLLQLIHI